jgi:1,2-diacylglycerol 3-alpha-glucosyltransferase
MRLVVFWDHILHYHAARIAALLALGEIRHDEAWPIALRSGPVDLPIGGYEHLLNGRVHVLSKDSLTAGVTAHQSKIDLLAKLDEIRPDVVAIIGYDHQVPRAALKWCRHNRRGAILMLESQAIDYPRIFWKEWIKSRIVGYYDAVLAGGTPQAAYARQLGMPTDRIFFGYDAVDNDYWSAQTDRVRKAPDVSRRSLALPEKYFLTACRFIPKKNLDGLIKSYAGYVEKANGDPWHLVIVGDGPLAGSIHNLAAELGINHLVHFPGYLSADNMAPYYALASAFVLASDHSEQWGLVVNEAMAAKLPVLVSQICGCAHDLVVEGVTGFAFDAKKYTELTNLLWRVASGQFDLLQIGDNARAHIQRFSTSVFAASLFAAAEVASAYAQGRPTMCLTAELL